MSLSLRGVCSAVFGLCLLACLGPSASHAAASDGIPVQWQGEWVQGGLILGQTEPGSSVWFKERKLRLTADGQFVFGLHRDEPSTVRIRIQTPDGEDHRFSRTVKSREYKIQRIDGIPQDKVSPPPETLKRIRSEGAMVARARHRDSTRQEFAGGFIWPAKGPISGVFGSQRILNGQPRQPHYGVDVAAPTGTPVYAPAGGFVSLVHDDMYFSGGTLMIDHGHGLSSAFLHLSKILVQKGQEVKQGDLIAEIGATGRVTGPHLDWRVNWFDARVDAQLLVPPMDMASD